MIKKYTCCFWILLVLLICSSVSPAQLSQAFSQGGSSGLNEVVMNDSRSGKFLFLNESITLSFKNIPFKTALSILTEKTKIKFSYSTNLIDTTKRISVQVENSSLANVLNEAFERNNIGWIPMEDGTVVLTTQNRAREETSTIRGKVVDSLSNEALIGVNVVIIGTSLGSATDIQGQFSVTGIPPRKFNVRISYIGYESKNMEIDFSRQSSLVLNIGLIPSVIKGQEITVTGQLRGQMAAINQQITSNTIVNVVSEEKIKELPDANAAEAIGRLPGVSIVRSGGEASKIVLRGMSNGFSTVTLDGVRIPPTDADSRGVDLSMVSQGSLAGIELYKALTPDKDADAIAGTVNLVTKSAPTERFIQVSAKNAYEKLNNTFQQYDLAIKYGERFFDDVLGLQITGNLERRDRSNENYEIDYIPNAGSLTDYLISNFKLQYTNEIRKRSGVSVILDINTPDNGSIKFSNAFSQTNRNYITYGRDYPTQAEDPLYTIRDQEQEIDNFNSALHGKNHFLGLTADWGISFAQSKAHFPYDYYMDFEEPSGAASGMNLPIKPEDQKNPEALPGYAFNNFSTAYMVWANYNSEENLDKEKTANIDFSKQYTIGNSLSGEWKLGGKYRIKNRMKDVNELTFNDQIEQFYPYEKLPDGTIQLKNFNGTRFQNLQLVGNLVLLTNFLDPTPANRNLYNKYPLNPMVNVDAIRLWYDLNKNGSNSNGTTNEYLSNYFIAANSYNVTERVSAGYIMNTLNFGQDVTLIAGVRVETEYNDYGSKYSPNGLSGFPTVAGTLKDTTAFYNETIWLPNAHLSIKPFDFMTVRIAAYRALARPDFNDRLEIFVAQNEGSTVQRGDLNPNLTVGNSQLPDAKAWNYEISTSFFGNTIGLLTISAYYKDIKDMFHLTDNLPVDGSNGQAYLDSVGLHWKNVFGGASYYITYPYSSSGSTHVWGFEIEHQMNTNFLPGLLSNFVLSYNVSLVRSETSIRSSVTGTRSDTTYSLRDPGHLHPTVTTTQFQKYIDLKEKLEGQPEFFGNVAIGYDIGGFSARASLFFQGEYTKIYSSDGRNDVIANSLSRWDLSIKQQIASSISVMLNINNVTNAEESTYIKNRVTGWNLPYTSNNYGVTADLGIQITI